MTVHIQLPHAIYGAERDLTTRKPKPSDPFDVSADKAYPRAGVRQLPNGRWKLTLWDAPGVVLVDERADSRELRDYPDAYSAFAVGRMRVISRRLKEAYQLSKRGHDGKAA